MPYKYFVGQISRLALSFPGFKKAWMKAASDAEKEKKSLVIFKVPAAVEAQLVEEIEKLIKQLIR